MMDDLRGKQAVIFGGVHALALGVAQVLREHGASVTFVTDERLAYGAVSGTTMPGGTLLEDMPLHAVDLGDPDALGTLVAALPAFDVAVFSPAWWAWWAFLDTDDAAWQSAVQQNFEAMVWALQAAGRRLVEQGRGGRMIALSSVTSMMPFEGAGALGTTLTALWAVCRMAAVDLGAHGITCNVVAAGWLEGDAALVSAEQRAHAARGVPLGRLGTPREVGEGVAFLASDRAAYINGAILPVDGGYTLTRSDGDSALDP